MFAPDAPLLAWDPQRQYSRDAIELYYMSHAAAPLPVDKLTEVHCWPGKLICDSYFIASQMQGCGQIHPMTKQTVLRPTCEAWSRALLAQTGMLSDAGTAFRLAWGVQ